MSASENALSDELRRLDAFVGTWDISMHVSGRLEHEGAATTSFEWLEGGRFLIQRSRADDPFPDGISIIGWDEERGGCLVHYFDSRGVARLYDLTFDGSTLEMSRPYAEGDFAQRFSGRLSDDGTRMEGRWEFSDDGEEWELDFELTYDRTS